MAILLDSTKYNLAGLINLPAPNEGSNFDVNTAARRMCAYFVADRSESMTGFKCVFDGNDGTVTNGCQADMYLTDANGEPTGSILATATFTPGNGTLTDVTWSVAYTTTALTAYIVVFQNVLGTPSANFFRMKPVGAFLGNWHMTSNDSGISWYYDQRSVSVKFWAKYITSGTVGFRFASGSSSGGSLNMYSTTGSRQARIANVYNFGVAVRLWALVVNTGRNITGSPTHYLRGEVCSASASLQESTTRVKLSNGNSSRIFFWDGGYALSPAIDYYIGITTGASTAGDSSNYTNEEVTGPMQTPTVELSGNILKGGYESTASGSPSWSSKSYWLDCSLWYTLESAGGSSSMLVQRGMQAGVSG